MKIKFLILSLIYSIILLAIGMYGSLYVFTGLELNDRLKYEASFARSHQKVLNQIKKGEYEKAEILTEVYIESYLQTLKEHYFFAGPELKIAIEDFICEVAAFREEHPPAYYSIENLSESDKEIMHFIETNNENCK